MRIPNQVLSLVGSAETRRGFRFWAAARREVDVVESLLDVKVSGDVEQRWADDVGRISVVRGPRASIHLQQGPIVNRLC